MQFQADDKPLCTQSYTISPTTNVVKEFSFRDPNLSGRHFSWDESTKALNLGLVPTTWFTSAWSDQVIDFTSPASPMVQTFNFFTSSKNSVLYAGFFFVSANESMNSEWIFDGYPTWTSGVYGFYRFGSSTGAYGQSQYTG